MRRDVMNTKSRIEDAKLAIQEVRKNRAFDPQEFGRRLAEYVDAKKVVKHPTVRVGDFDATPESGNFYLVKCRKCGLTGRLALPDDCNRNKCPRCRKIDVSEWQRLGFGSLVPVQRVTVKPLNVATIESQELDEPAEIEIEDDTMVELSLSVAPIEAGQDTPESESEIDLTDESTESEEEPVETDGEGA
jgi:hypothetical protein